MPSLLWIIPPRPLVSAASPLCMQHGALPEIQPELEDFVLRPDFQRLRVVSTIKLVKICFSSVQIVA